VEHAPETKPAHHDRTSKPSSASIFDRLGISGTAAKVDETVKPLKAAQPMRCVRATVGGLTE